MMQRKIIRQNEQIKCRHCGKLFIPEPRSAGRQEYCSRNDECKKASKAASQKRWLAKNPDHFKGAVNVKRVQLWRQENPGYSQCQKKQDTLQDSLKTQPAKNTDNFDFRKIALQDFLSSQHIVLLGLIHMMFGNTLQDTFAVSLQHMRKAGEDFLTNFFNGGNNGFKTSYLSGAAPEDTPPV